MPHLSHPSTPAHPPLQQTRAIVRVSSKPPSFFMMLLTAIGNSFLQASFLPSSFKEEERAQRREQLVGRTFLRQCPLWFASLSVHIHGATCREAMTPAHTEKSVHVSLLLCGRQEDVVRLRAAVRLCLRTCMVPCAPWSTCVPAHLDRRREGRVLSCWSQC